MPTNSPDKRPRRRTALALAAFVAVVGAAGVAVIALRDDDRRETKRLPLPSGGAKPGAGRSGVSAGGGAAAGTDVVPSSERAQHLEGRILVRFAPGTTAEMAESVLGRADADEAARVPRLGIRAVETDSAADVDDALAVLDAAPAVVYAERDVVVEAFDVVPNDVLWPDQWGPALMRAPSAWTLSRGSAATVVAVIDTGVDPNHPDLRGRLVAGRDFVNEDDDASDDQGHGTAVAGILAARSSNSEGTAGMCWTCPIMPVKVLDQSGTGSTAAVAAGVVWAADHGARIINLSLGSPTPTQTLADAVAYALAKGTIVVAAAGNSGVATPFYPAAHGGVVSVAATDESDRLYSWSNYGAAVTLGAPGCNVAPSNGGGYANVCGTSAAAPLVAGTAAIAVASRPQATPREVAVALGATTRAIPETPLAGGRIVADAAVRALAPAPPPAPTPTSAAPANLEPPSVTGAPRVGATLTASPGRWSGTPGFAYAWERCDAVGASCAATGRTGTTYAVSAADTRFSLRVTVTARGGDASRGVASPAVGPVALRPPTNLARPKVVVVSGGTRPTLRALEGSWTGAPTRFRYQWQSCRDDGTCTNIVTATERTYTARRGASAERVRVIVRAANESGASTATSQPAKAKKGD